MPMFLIQYFTLKKLCMIFQLWVCVCIHGLPACSTIKHKITAYPGEAFQIPAVAVGQQFGTVPFTVHCRFIPINSSNLSQMKSMQGSQVVGRNCTNLSFTILSSNRFEDMMLTVDKFNVSCQT